MYLPWAVAKAALSSSVGFDCMEGAVRTKVKAAGRMRSPARLDTRETGKASQLEELFARWGLPAVFVGGVAEGDITLVLAGVIAHLEMMPIVPLALAAFLGLLASDTLWFALGRWGGSRLRGVGWYRKAADAVEQT